jgi:hypothetical protein
MTAPPTKKPRYHPPRMAASSQLVRAVNGSLIDSSQVSELANSLHQSSIPPNTTATTEPTSNVTSSAVKTIVRCSTRMKKRSAVLVENELLMAEKALTTTLEVANRAAKHRRLVFHQGI